jgi:hypothetical protein
MYEIPSDADQNNKILKTVKLHNTVTLHYVCKLTL